MWSIRHTDDVLDANRNTVERQALGFPGISKSKSSVEIGMYPSMDDSISLLILNLVVVDDLASCYRTFGKEGLGFSRSEEICRN